MRFATPLLASAALYSVLALPAMRRSMSRSWSKPSRRRSKATIQSSTRSTRTSTLIPRSRLGCGLHLLERHRDDTRGAERVRPEGQGAV